jgi:cytochrome c peroxidase
VSDQSRAAFTNTHEMGLTMPEVLTIVQTQPYYPWLFAQATGDTVVTEDHIFTALTHFMGAMSASHAKLDAALAIAGIQPDINIDFQNFTAAENNGKQLYLAHCVSCHGSVNSIQKIFEANNGLEKPYTDKGKGAISGKFYENGTFKVPGLRNIELTAPYMHDGRFKTLEAVVEHYNSGVIEVFGLHGDLLSYDPDTQDYTPKRLNLTEIEKQAALEDLWRDRKPPIIHDLSQIDHTESGAKLFASTAAQAVWPVEAAAFAFLDSVAKIRDERAAAGLRATNVSQR